MAASAAHPTLGSLHLIRNAVTMTDADATVRTTSPDPGEHNAEVLTELGLSAPEIADLRDRGIT
jgi:crotonobetainyl-CoA:carnitine CoA-transferase CaiB-like acyl-CoA transferase